MTIERNYFQSLKTQLKKISTLSSIQSVLSWDQETMMPSHSLQHRSEQLAVISGLAHEQLISDDFKQTLGKLVDFWSQFLNTPI